MKDFGHAPSEMAMQKPHEFVLNEVKRRWSYERSKGFFTKLIELGEIKAVAIVILEKENFVDKRKFRKGKILNRWRYDDTGLQYIPKNEDVDQNRVEYCAYCINRKKKRLLIEWTNISTMDSSKKDIHYFCNGTFYEIVESNGIEDFKVIRVWIE
jgi:hypothetical protein